MNKHMIIGYVGADPDVRYLNNGTAVASFSVATSERWTDKDTGEKQERTDWHRCSVFGKRAEVIGEYVRKGSRIYCEGRSQTRKWQDRDGIDRWTTEINVSDFEFLDAKPSNRPPHPAEQGQQEERPRGQPQTSTSPPDDFDDDIPF